MPHFIKTGYWEKAVKNYKGWLDLEQLIGSSSVINSGGGTSLGSGNGLPSGQVYGRFFFDTGDSSFYFDDGSTWNAIGGGTPTTPNIDAVLSAGYQSSQIIQVDGYLAYSPLTQFIKNVFGNNAFNFTGTFGDSVNTNCSGSYFDFQRPSSFSSVRVFTTNDNVSSNVNGGSYCGNQNGFVIVAGKNSTFNINNLQNSNALFGTYNNYFSDTGASINVQYCIDFQIKPDSKNGNGTTTIANRIGLNIMDFKNVGITYTKIWSIYSEGSLIPMYHAGIGFFGTLTNLATTNVAMSIGKPINYQNSTTNSAGSASGEYLTVYINGVQRKIALLNP